MAEAVAERLTPAKAAWRKLGFCECGRPEDVLGLLHRGLRCLADRGAAEAMIPTHRGWGTAEDKAAQALELAVLPVDDVGSLLVRYVLDAMGLTEHGGSVFGCWLSEEGASLLAFMDATPREEWMDEP